LSFVGVGRGCRGGMERGLRWNNLGLLSLSLSPTNLARPMP